MANAQRVVQMRPRLQLVQRTPDETMLGAARCLVDRIEHGDTVGIVFGAMNADGSVNIIAAGAARRDLTQALALVARMQYRIAGMVDEEDAA